MSDVVDLPMVTRMERSATRVMARASAERLKQAIVIGFDEDGDFYFDSTHPDGKDALWLINVAHKKLLEAGGA